jgi:hypothetical protein
MDKHVEAASRIAPLEIEKYTIKSLGFILAFMGWVSLKNDLNQILKF